MEAITLSHVSKRFGHRLVLRQVSLRVHGGDVLLLTGANGAGKSTLLRLMAGLDTPDDGVIERACQPHEVGYLGHETWLYQGLSALENLVFWRDMYEIDAHADAILAMLAHVGLTRFVHDRVSTFSRGMAQRLNLARVLLQKPRLWLLDEPSTGLDVDATALLHASIGEAREQGAAIVWISHDQTRLPHVTNVLHLDKGRLVQNTALTTLHTEAACSE